MPNPINNASLFLINTLFDLYLFVIIARIILAYVRVDYYNPLTQFIIKITQPVITPLRRKIPNIGNVETASIVFALLLEIIRFALIGFIVVGTANIVGILLLSAADILKTIINVFFYAIIIQAIMSWVQQGYNPMSQILMQVTAPIMRPLHRFIPPIGGIDISPIVALIGLQFLSILLINPLLATGSQLSFT
jgi:YggT family protein